jgi:hypothetical protein
MLWSKLRSIVQVNNKKKSALGLYGINVFVSTSSDKDDEEGTAKGCHCIDAHLAKQGQVRTDVKNTYSGLYLRLFLFV